MRARSVSGISSKLVDVLVVEDDPGHRELIVAVLTESLCLVRSASSAAEGLEVALAKPPDVVVIDLDLASGMTGWALAGRLSEHPATEHVARVAVTGLVEPRFEIVRVVDAYIRKPIDPRLLGDLVLQLASVARSARTKLAG